MKTKPVCLTCGGAVVHGNLYCSHKCGDGKVSHSKNRKALEARGFVADPEISNAYTKDGVLVTLEMVAHVGLDKAIVQHEAAASIRARAGLSEPTEAA